MSSSSSSVTFHSVSGELEEDNLGIPKICRCGVHLVLRTSKTPKHPGRLFYSCPKDYELKGMHTFKWTDISVVEEVEAIKGNLLCYEDEIRRLKVSNCGYEKAIEDLRGEVKRIKLIAVGIVIIGFVYWFH